MTVFVAALGIALCDERLWHGNWSTMAMWTESVDGQSNTASNPGHQKRHSMRMPVSPLVLSVGIPTFVILITGATFGVYSVFRDDLSSKQTGNLQNKIHSRSLQIMPVLKSNLKTRSKLFPLPKPAVAIIAFVVFAIFIALAVTLVATQLSSTEGGQARPSPSLQNTDQASANTSNGSNDKENNSSSIAAANSTGKSSTNIWIIVGSVIIVVAVIVVVACCCLREKKSDKPTRIQDVEPLKTNIQPATKPRAELPKIIMAPQVQVNTMPNSHLPLASSIFKNGPRGLANLGKSCFLNATLQCLAHVLTLEDRAALTTGNEVERKLAETLALIKDGTEGVVNPRGFLEVLGKYVPQYSNCLGTGQDAKELLTGIIRVCPDLQSLIEHTIQPDTSKLPILFVDHTASSDSLSEALLKMVLTPQPISEYPSKILLICNHIPNHDRQFIASPELTVDGQVYELCATMLYVRGPNNAAHFVACLVFTELTKTRRVVYADDRDIRVGGVELMDKDAYIYFYRRRLDV
jgi:hypothetical protein